MPVTTEVRVRYAETDKMGVVYYANYLVWFEIGRVELLRSLRLSYREMETENGCLLPVVEASCRYRAPARYDDQIEIESWPSLLRGPVIKFAYNVWRKATEIEERTLLAEGETVHVACNAEMIKIPLPKAYATALRALLEEL